MIDKISEYLALPLPNEQNMLEDDCPRIVQSFKKLDAHAKATDTALAARLAQADAADEAIAVLQQRATATETAQGVTAEAIAALQERATATETAHGVTAATVAGQGQTLLAHAALLAATDSAGHAKADGTTISAAADGTLSVLSAPLWQGRALHVSANAPTDADGAVGDLWLKIAG